MLQTRLAGYLDGALAAGEHARIREHVETCAACRSELHCYQQLSTLISRADRAAPPPGLAFRIRVAAFEKRTAESWRKRMWRRLTLLVQNSLEPMALPATGGLASSLAIFVILIQQLLGGVSLGAVPNDLPLNLVQPARLEALAPFPVPGGEWSAGQVLTGLLIVEATVNARGEMVDYQILVGPDDLATRRQLDQVLMFSRFRPQFSFGVAKPGGRVVLSFSEVRVKG
jgi:anti-sigma factor RsiW